MLILAEKNGFGCALLEQGEFHVFKDVFLACEEDRSVADQALIDVIKGSEGQCLRVFFDDEDVDHFVLFKLNENNQPHYVGKSSVVYKGTVAEFEDLYVLSDFRKQGLSNLLYDAMLDHLRQQKCDFTQAHLHINDWNTPSLRAAAKNGFVVNTQEKHKGGFIPFVRDVSDEGPQI